MITPSPRPNWRRADAILLGSAYSSFSSPQPSMYFWAGHVLDERQGHADARGAEAVVPIDPVRAFTTFAEP